MKIVWNADDQLWEVPVSRNVLVKLIDVALSRVTDIEPGKRTALRAVGRSADRVLANTSKGVGLDGGCPAIMAQVNYLNVPYENATLGLYFATENNFGIFPREFDSIVTIYVEGMIAAGGRPLIEDQEFFATDALRLVVN